MMRTKMRTVAWICAIVLLLGSTIPCLADAQDDLIAIRQEQEETLSSLISVQERIDAIEAKKGQSEAYLLELNKQISELNAELETIQAAFGEKQHELDITNLELAQALKDQERQRENMAIRIRYMYENSMDAGILEAVFSADSFTDLLNRAENMTELTNYDRRMLEDYEEVCRLVEERKAKVEQEQKEIDALRDEIEAKRADMLLLSESTSEEVASLAKNLKDSEGKASQLISEIEQQQAQIYSLSIEVAAQVAAAEAAAEEARIAAEAQQSATPSPSSTEETTTPSETSAETTEPTATGDGGEKLTYSWEGPRLTRQAGTNQGPTGKETYYNLNMSGVVNIMRNMGNNDEYWVREDGVKMLGDYVMVAANLENYPRGSLVESSLGTAIVCDTGTFAADNPEQLDIAVAW